VVARDYRHADLFDGFQTANRTRAAENQVSGAREARRVMEQTILLNAATAHMDVLRDTAPQFLCLIHGVQSRPGSVSS
jgi:hypothetical protein